MKDWTQKQESAENSEPGSRQRSPSPDNKRPKPAKRRKTSHRAARVTFTDGEFPPVAVAA